jgi:hypothetical protein
LLIKHNSIFKSQPVAKPKTKCEIIIGENVEHGIAEKSQLFSGY